MAYYDTSDTMYSFQNLKRERQEEEEKYAKRAQYAAKGAANLWKMYSSDQKLKTKELLDQKIKNPKFVSSATTPDEPEFLNVYERNPAHGESKFLEKITTPAGGRVKFTEAGKTAFDAGTKTTEGKAILEKGVETFGGKGGYLEKVGIETLQSGKGMIKKVSDPTGKILTAEPLKKFKPDFMGDVGLLHGGLTALQTYDYLDQYRNMSNEQRVAKGLATGLSLYSLFNPAAAPFALAAGLGSSQV